MLQGFNFSKLIFFVNTCVHNKFVWPLVRLHKCYALGVSIANTWVRVSSYTKEDIRRSQPVWSP